MIHSALLSQSVPSTRSVPASAAPSVANLAPSVSGARTLACQSALHDMNNLLLIMSTYTSLAVDKLAVDSPAYGHMRQAQEAVSQAALFAHELRTTLK